VSVIGENINLRRTAMVEVGEGVVAGYLHGQLTPGLGRIGVLVGLRSSGDPEKLHALGRQLAMHVAATNPQAVTPEGLDVALIARERAIFADQARASGKPENIVEKMIDGRMRKYYEEVALLEQAFVVDPNLRVKEAVAQAAKDIGAPVEVVGFERFALGEGSEATDAETAA
jgi:elongation factor Ts